MSKGWESKNVEEQQSETAASHAVVKEDRRLDAEKTRKIQALEMQRERVLSERTASPHRRSALTQALESIEYELQQLGWSIKL